MRATEDLNFDIDEHDDVESNLTDALDITVEKLNPSEVADQISQRYQITTDSLSKFSTNYAEAYQVEDLVDVENKNLYALIFKKNMPIRLLEIMKLAKEDLDNMQNVVDYGVTQISHLEEEFFITIVEKPKGKTFKKIVDEGFRFDLNNLKNTYLPQFFNAIKSLHRLGIAHEVINPNFIYIDGDHITLGNCIDTVEGERQEVFYETVGRAQCNKVGKSQNDISADCYALGVLIFYGLSGRDFRSTQDIELIRQKLFHGTYHFLNAAFHIDGAISDLIKGLVADSSEIRWSLNEVDHFLKGKTQNYNSVDLSYLSRAITFNGKEHYSKRSLAYDLAQNWDDAKSFIKTDKLKRWLESSTSQEKYVEALSLTQGNFINRSIPKRIISLSDEKLMKTLAIIDPEGPIRYKDLVFYKDGIGKMLAQSVSNSDTELTKTLVALLYVNPFTVYESISTTYSNTSLAKKMDLINRCSEFLKKSGYGFGMERCLYELNPTLICQSNLLSGVFCIGVKDVLQCLEKSNMEFEDLVSQKTIACFIASKISLDSEVRNYDLKFFPAVQRSRAFQIMEIFAKAQKHSNINNLINLCQSIKSSVQDVLDSALRSVTIRRKLFEELSQSASSGSIMEIQKTAINKKYISDDIEGYAKALKRGAQISKELFSYNNKKLIDFDIRRKSLRFAVRFSYVVCGLIMLSILLQTI